MNTEQKRFVLQMAVDAAHERAEACERELRVEKQRFDDAIRVERDRLRRRRGTVCQRS